MPRPEISFRISSILHSLTFPFSININASGPQALKMASTLKQIAKNPASVHITMDPVPRSISDSKRVLAALRKFGEVATFRNLKVGPIHTRNQIHSHRQAKDREESISSLTRNK